MQNDHLTQRVKDFVLGQFPLARQQATGDDDSLLEGGIIDSLGILEVVTFLEAEFQLTLSDDEMVSDNFQSISSIAQFVQQKIAEGSAITSEG